MTYIVTYEHQVVQLCGCTIRAVRYLDFPTDDGTPTWNSASFDVLHCGIELETDQRGMFAFTWDGRNPDFGIAVSHQPIANEFTTPLTVWDVTRTRRWAASIGIPITNTTVTWIYPQMIPDRVPATPLTIQLMFANGSHVYIAYGGYQEHDEHGTIADALTLVFDNEVARRRNIGPYMPRQFQYRP